MRVNAMRQSFRWLAILVLTCSVLQACQVPVFRYALERWKADHYSIVVIHEGQPDDAATATLEQLKTLAATETSGFHVQTVDIANSPSKLHTAIWREYSGIANGKPLMAVLYPERAQVEMRVAHCLPLTAENVQAVAASPVRNKVVKHLLNGDSAAWIFVPSGTKAKDDAALKILQEELAKEAKRIKLPTAEELEVSEAAIEASRIGLRIGFSVVQLDRNDPAERFLLDSLLNSEADLRDFDEPMAFPVFGRGRVLYALIGKGISPETIGAATTFMTGPCSCQVKSQNPGFDLLTGWDWNKSVGSNLISEPLPESTGKAVLLRIPSGRKKSDDTKSKSPR